MLQFLAPTFLWLAALAVVPVLLYLFRRKSKTVRVSTLVFFKSLAREHQESAWLRRLKKLLSLLLTLIVLLGTVAALSRMVASPKIDDVRSVVVLLDRSASMGAEDAEGVSRIDLAKELLRARLAALPEAIPVSLVVYDARPEVLQPKTPNRRAVLRALDGVVARPVEDREHEALASASQIARLEAPAQVWHATDRAAAPAATGPGGGGGGGAATVPGGTPDDGGDGGGGAVDGPAPEDRRDLRFPQGVTEVRINVGLPEPINVGITAFRIRPVPLQHARYQAYIQVGLSRGSPGPAEARMLLQVGAGIPQPRLIDLEPGGRSAVLLEDIQGAQDQEVRISVSVPGDCFSRDDEIITRLPEYRPLVVLWVAEEDPGNPGEGLHDPYTGIALGAIATEGEIDILKGHSGNWPPADLPDVVLFDGWVPGEWPAGTPAVVINPPGSSGPVRAAPIAGGGIPHESVRMAGGEHPVLFRVSSSRVEVTQTAVIDTSGSVEPLWFAGGEPVLAAGEVAGQRLVLMAFSPQRSERLPLTASFPLLVGNALYWCAERGLNSTQAVDLKTGSVIDAGGTSVVWRALEGGEVKPVVDPVQGRFAELDRVGLWQTEDGRGGAAMLLSRHETDLAAGPGGPEDGAGGAGGAVGGLRGELTPWFIVLVIVVLLVESFLFHRLAIY